MERRIGWRLSFYRIVLPLLAVVVCGAAATGYYYHRVTGDALRMTYQVNRETYAMAPYFLWQTPRPEPVYRHESMREFYQWELRDFQKNRTLAGYLSMTWGKVTGLWRFYLGPLLTLPLLALPLGAGGGARDAVAACDLRGYGCGIISAGLGLCRIIYLRRWACCIF